MRCRSIISSLLCAAFLLAACQAQTGDWLAVQNIPSGYHLTVKSGGYTVRCIFEHASENELFCEQRRFDRQSVRQVRLEHNLASAAFGAVIGTGVGAATGAAVTKGSSDAETRAYVPFYLGIGLGVLVSVIMSKLPIFHGRVIYRN